MTTPLRDALTQRINQVGPAHPDIGELVGLGDQRLRRRRLAAMTAAGAAVALAIALAIGGTALHRSADQHPGPVHRPPSNPDQTQGTTPNTLRPIVYSDVTFVPGGPNSLLGDPIHVGDLAVETGSGWVHMDVTDDGVVYTTGGYQDDGRVWFTDGGTPEQVGSHACPGSRGGPNAVVTGNSGSLAAWSDCTPGPGQPQLVIYDTSSGQREPSPACTTGCSVYAVVGDHVYFTQGTDPGGFLFDTATGRISEAPLEERAGDPVIPGWSGDVSQAYLDDIRSHPRGLVVGDSWDTGTPTPSGFGVGFQFAVVGTRLVPSRDGHLTSAFDTGTRRPIELHLPAGYKPDPSELDDGGFGLFEWLDDDTVALENFRTGRHDQDILTCRLSTGRCELAVPSLGRNGHYRVVQNENLGNVQFEIPHE